jgi:SPP1 family predicted phage head-tail adaptor
MVVLNAAELNRRIQVRRFEVTGQDGLGGTLGDWTDRGGPLFARRRDLSDEERMKAWGIENLLTTRFVIRNTQFARDIKRSDRLVHEGVEFEIVGIKEFIGTRGFLEITAKTRDAR